MSNRVSDMSPLERVQRAALARRKAELRYREAIRQAAAAGATYAAIGRAAGISRQAAHELAHKPTGHEGFARQQAVTGPARPAALGPRRAAARQTSG